MSDFDGDLLRALGAPITSENTRFLRAWRQAEGTKAAYNPLATTQPAQGASAFNSVGVRNYPSYQTGVTATLQTLTNGRYKPIVQGLRSGKATAEQLARAVAASPWGTGDLVLSVLGAGTVDSESGMAAPPAAGSVSQSNLASAGGDSNPQLDFAMGLLQARRERRGGGQPDIGGLVRALQTARAAVSPQESLGVQSPSASPAGDPGLATGGAGGAQGMLEAIARAQKLGLSVRENPYTDPVDPVHVEGSYHYQTYGGQKLGRAIDVSGAPATMKAFTKWALGRYGQNLTELFYDPLGGWKNGSSIGAIGGHSDHVHLAL